MAEWWNTSYYFRRGIAITPDPLRPVEAGHPVYVDIPYPVYIASNKLRADFEDFAIVYAPLEGATPVDSATPLNYRVPHKVLYSAENDTLQVVFNAVEEILVGPNLDYYIYFNNPSLTNVVEPDSFEDSDYVINTTPAEYNSNLTFSRPNEDWINGKSSVINARAALVFYGVNARVKVVKGPNRGVMELRLDDQTPILVDTWAPTEVEEIVYTTSGLDVGRHYIRIRVTGEKLPSSQDYEIELAAFQYSNYVQALILDEEIYSYAGTFSTIVGP